MIPVDQQHEHRPEQGQYGDCQRAVLASLLELPIEEVPHFLGEAKGDTNTYYQLLQKFCNSRGYAYLTTYSDSVAFYDNQAPLYHEIAGPSPRGEGVWHAVVGCNGEIVFDPHPSRAGLIGDPKEWLHCYLVKLCNGDT